MTEQKVVLNKISWRDLCPWLVVFRVFRVSVSAPLLFFALLGSLLAPVGWRASELLTLGDHYRTKDGRFEQFVLARRGWLHSTTGVHTFNSVNSADSPGAAVVQNVSAREITLGNCASWFTSLPVDAASRFISFMEPFVQIFDSNRSLQEFGYICLGSVWTLLVWALCGGVIIRVAAVHLGREERIGVGEAVRHAGRKLRSYFLAPLYPMLGVLFFTLCLALLGLAMRASWGTLAGGILWAPALLAAFVMAVLLLGLAVGWPLMWGTISAEGSDEFDAMARCYAYVFQRPLHYLFYWIMAAVLGAFGFLFVAAICNGVEHLSWWAASWGMGSERTEVLRTIVTAPAGGESASTMDAAGAWLIRLCIGLLGMLPTAFGFSYFWCASSCVYLLIRKDVDRTELDEVFVENEDANYGLPELGFPASQPNEEATPSEINATDNPPAEKSD